MGNRIIKKSENEIQKEIFRYLKMRNIPNTRHHAGRVRIGKHWLNLGEAGWSDILCCLPPYGKFLAVEVKKPGEDLSGMQEKIKYDIEQAGGIVIVVRSVEELAAKLKRIFIQEGEEEK